MNIFAFHIMSEIKGKIPFFKLEYKGNINIDDFEKEVSKSKKLSSQYKTILANMENLSNLKGLPANKYKPLDKGKERTGVFEFKSKDLRVYGMSLPNKKVIIIGGYKSNKQTKNIKLAKRIAKEIKEIQNNGTQ